MIDLNQARFLVSELAALIPQILRVDLPLPGFGQADQEGDPVWTKFDPVFTGGCVVSLLITDDAAAAPSLTKDIDAVVRMASYQEFTMIESKLRGAGFEQDMFEKAGVIAWQWNGVRVDILPSEPIAIMQTVNKWFPALLRDARRVEVAPGRYAWIASGPCFLATKLEAFFNRGKDDYLGSKDIEDIIAVVDGRKEIEGEVMASEPALAQFVSLSFRRLLSDERFEDAVIGSVREEGREILLLGVMESIASLFSPLR